MVIVLLKTNARQFEWGETLRLIQIQIQKIHFKSDHILRYNFKEKANLLVKGERLAKIKIQIQIQIPKIQKCTISN